MGLTWWPSSKTPRFQCRRHRFDPGRRSKIPYMPHGVHPSPTTKKSIDEFLRKVIMPSCSVQSLSHVRHFATPWTAARQACLSVTNSQSLLKLMSIELVMPSIQPSHPLSSLSPPAFNLSIIRVFSNESVLCIRWPNYWNFNFNISPFREYSGLISFRMVWLDLLAVQQTLKSLLQHHQKHQFFGTQLSL